MQKVIKPEVFFWYLRVENNFLVAVLVQEQLTKQLGRSRQDDLVHDKGLTFFGNQMDVGKAEDGLRLEVVDVLLPTE